MSLSARHDIGVHFSECAPGPYFFRVRFALFVQQSTDTFQQDAFGGIMMTVYTYSHHERLNFDAAA